MDTLPAPSGLPPDGPRRGRRSSIMKPFSVFGNDGEKFSFNAEAADAKKRRRVSFAANYELRNYCKEQPGLEEDTATLPVSDLDRVSPLPESERNEASPMKIHHNNDDTSPLPDENDSPGSNGYAMQSRMSSVTFMDLSTLTDGQVVERRLEHTRHSIHDMSISDNGGDTSSNSSCDMHNTSLYHHMSMEISTDSLSDTKPHSPLVGKGMFEEQTGLGGDGNDFSLFGFGSPKPESHSFVMATEMDTRRKTSLESHFLESNSFVVASEVDVRRKPSLESDSFVAASEAMTVRQASLEYQKDRTIAIHHEKELTLLNDMPPESTSFILASEIVTSRKSSLEYHKDRTITTKHEKELTMLNDMPLDSNSFLIASEIATSRKPSLEYQKDRTITIKNEKELSMLNDMPLDSNSFSIASEIATSRKPSLEYQKDRTITVKHEKEATLLNDMLLDSNSFLIASEIVTTRKPSLECKNNLEIAAHSEKEVTMVNDMSLEVTALSPSAVDIPVPATSGMDISIETATNPASSASPLPSFDAVFAEKRQHEHSQSPRTSGSLNQSITSEQNRTPDEQSSRLSVHDMSISDSGGEASISCVSLQNTTLHQDISSSMEISTESTPVSDSKRHSSPGVTQNGLIGAGNGGNDFCLFGLGSPKMDSLSFVMASEMDPRRKSSVPTDFMQSDSFLVASKVDDRRKPSLESQTTPRVSDTSGKFSLERKNSSATGDENPSKPSRDSQFIFTASETLRKSLLECQKTPTLTIHQEPELTMMTIPPEDITSRLADVEFDAPEQFEIPEPSGIYTANKTLQTSYEDDDGQESPLPSFTTFFQRQYQRDNSLSPANSRTFVEYPSPSSNDTLSSLDTTVSEPRSGDSDEVIPRNTRNVLLDLEKSLVQESVQEDSGPLSLASLLKSVGGLGVTVTENGSGPAPSQSSLAVDAGRSSPSVQNEEQLQSGPSFVRRRTFVDLPTPVSSNDSFTSLETTLVEPNQELSEDEEKPEDSEFLKFFRLQIARAFLLCDVVRRDPARYFLTITGQRSVLVLFLHIPLAVPTTADALRLIHWDLQKLTGRIRLDKVHKAASSIPRKGDFVVRLVEKIIAAQRSEEQLIPPRLPPPQEPPPFLAEWLGKKN